jgi:hypothetical protein
MENPRFAASTGHSDPNQSVNSEARTQHAQASLRHENPPAMPDCGYKKAKLKQPELLGKLLSESEDNNFARSLFERKQRAPKPSISYVKFACFEHAYSLQSSISLVLVELDTAKTTIYQSYFCHQTTCQPFR